MKTLYKEKSHFLLASTFFVMLLFTSCSKDDEVQDELSIPTIENVEIGSGNNGIGVIGRDFHFDMDVVAGNFIETVQVKIQPKSSETYAQDWSFEITWDEFQGLKNTNVHKHFDIPEDAVEGIYDFIIIVNDQNGTTLEETQTVEIVDPSNLPVDPLLYIWTTTTNEGDFYFINETLVNPENVEFSEGEIIKSNAVIENVKGSGKLYLLLIKKSLNHLPESVQDIDFSKVIVYDVFEHKDEEDVFSFGNVIYDGKGGQDRSSPELSIGAAVDNNTPQSNPIDGDKTWETGDYYFGVIYTNATYDLSIHHYFELNVIMD